MIVESAHLGLETPAHPFRYPKARSFQNDFLKWLHEGDEQICVVTAPTGAGKTAAFSEICRAKSQTLLVYPTNALLKQQQKTLENDFGIDASILSGSTLVRRGPERVKELKGYAERFTGDVVLTNPDILQAIIQNMYTDIAGEAMEFFDKFDGVVYDEFHFYDDFEASGLFLQTKIISERVPNAKIAFSSATPRKNKALIQSLRDFLGDVIDWIRAKYADDGDAFRHRTEVTRNGESLWENRDDAIQLLEETAEEYGDADEPIAVLIFNSAFRSNQFYNILVNETELGPLVEKDNGYDTQQKEETHPEDHPILITTKKGEVGLDYDIRLLLMENPRDASDFLQRFGRAGRKSEAEVRIYGLGKLSWWRDYIPFQRFVENIYESIGSSQTKTESLESLAGLRAAHAVHSMATDQWSGWYPEARADFTNVPEYGTWSYFLSKKEEALNGDGDRDGAFYENIISRRTKGVLRFIDDCEESLRSLRGRGLSANIRYPRGDTDALTSYDLLSILQNYRIEAVESDTGSEVTEIVVEPKNPEDRTQLRVTFPGFEKEHKPYSGPLNRIEADLRDWIRKRMRQAKLEEEAEISSGLIDKFFSLVRITRSAIPHEIYYGEHGFEVDRSSTPPRLVEKGAE